MFLIALKKILFYGILGCVIFPLYVRTQDTTDDLLSREVFNVSLQGNTVHQILSDLAVNNNIPIGFDNVLGGNPPCRLKRRIDFHIAEITVGDLFRRIMSSTSDCDWKIDDEVINVFSKKETSRFSDIVIGNIEIPRGLSKEGIKEGIIKSPEVNAALSSQGLRLTAMFTSISQTEPVSDSFSLSCHNIPLRTILNEIVKSGNSKYWNLSNWGNDKRMVFLNF